MRLATAVTLQTTVTVVAAPVITSFTSGAPTSTAGASTILTAVFSGGTGSVDNSVGAVTTNVAVNVSPTVTTTYTPTVTNTANVSVTRQVTVNVVPAPVITSFTPGSATIIAPNSTTLTAVFTGGTGSVNNGVGTVTSGTPVTITPSATTTYTLTVTNAASTSVTAQTTVTVHVPPTISKLFGVSAISQGGVTSMAFTINNPNTTSSLSGVGFTDTLTGGLQVNCHSAH